MAAEKASVGSRLRVYGAPETHQAVSRLIRRRSTNPVDIRELALAGRDLSDVRRVLDLGCGFGFMAEVLAPRLPAEAQLTGVDACPANREPFLARLAAAGRRGEFLQFEVDEQLPWPDAYFDLVVSSYSLYFFPGIVAEVARVLGPGGRFLALTHHESAVAALLRAAGLPVEGPLNDLVRQFSGESGLGVLEPWFASVLKQDFRNELVFLTDQQEELFAYLSFKLRFLVECEDTGERSCSSVEKGLRLRLGRQLQEGTLRLPKDDAFFWALKAG